MRKRRVVVDVGDVGCGRFGNSFILQYIILQLCLPKQQDATTHSMAIPSIQQLDRPEPLHQVMAKDKPEDCLPCRVTG